MAEGKKRDLVGRNDQTYCHILGWGVWIISSENGGYRDRAQGCSGDILNL